MTFLLLTCSYMPVYTSISRIHASRSHFDKVQIRAANLSTFTRQNFVKRDILINELEVKLCNRFQKLATEVSLISPALSCPWQQLSAGQSHLRHVGLHDCEEHRVEAGHPAEPAELVDGALRR